MAKDLVLIETNVLEDILERAFAWDLHEEYGNELTWSAKNRKIMQKKHDFLSQYVNISLNANETIADGIEKYCNL